MPRTVIKKFIEEFLLVSQGDITYLLVVGSMMVVVLLSSY